MTKGTKSKDYEAFDMSIIETFKEHIKEREEEIRKEKNRVKELKEGLKILKENEQLCRKIREWAYSEYMRNTNLQDKLLYERFDKQRIDCVKEIEAMIGFGNTGFTWKIQHFEVNKVENLFKSLNYSTEIERQQKINEYLEGTIIKKKSRKSNENR